MRSLKETINKSLLFINKRQSLKNIITITRKVFIASKNQNKNKSIFIIKIY
jgi:hypothetical protein